MTNENVIFRTSVIYEYQRRAVLLELHAVFNQVYVSVGRKWKNYSRIQSWKLPEFNVEISIHVGDIGCTRMIVYSQLVRDMYIRFYSIRPTIVYMKMTMKTAIWK